jgi:hypothetical protein
MEDGCGPFSTIRTHIAPAALHVYFPPVHTPRHLSPRDRGVTGPGSTAKADLHIVVPCASLEAHGASCFARGAQLCCVPFVSPELQGSPGQQGLDDTLR